MDAIFETATGLLYDSAAHSETVAATVAAHKARLAQQQRLHEEELQSSALMFIEASKQKRALFTEAIQHKQTLAENESKRDLWQQRNEATQTVMFVCTVAFVCAYSLIVDGLFQWQGVVAEYPPITIAYAVLAGLSLFLILVSFSLCLLLYHRMGLYQTLGTYHFCSRRCRYKHITFTGYYYHHCLPLERAMLGFFFAGICCTLGGLFVYQLPKHLYVFEHTELCVIFGATVAIGILWPVVGMFTWPFGTWHEKENPQMRME